MSDPLFENDQQRVSEIVHSLEEENREDLETVTHILSKITHLPSEQIKPCLHAFMENLIELQETPFHASAAPEEWSQRFSAWVERHRGLGLPLLSNEAISREGIYVLWLANIIGPARNHINFWLTLTATENVL